jgi:alpha-D-ribose 1-methylphosphonate 5-triphosphate synthase subunit PhnL
MIFEPILRVRDLAKEFTLHNRGGARIQALAGVSFDVHPGECLVLAGPSGAGKSTLLRCVYGNYLARGGSIRVDGVEIAGADHRTILELRRTRIGYVSQFLRAVPRVPAREVVAEPLLARGVARAAALERADSLLDALGISAALRDLPPATFSGGEQQRVNLARGFAAEFPLMLLDEPTSALDASNRRRVAALIDDAKRRGCALVGVFHDEDMAAAVGTRRHALEPVRLAA